MSKIRDKKGNSLIQIKKFLIDLLRYNDNSSNEVLVIAKLYFFNIISILIVITFVHFLILWHQH